MSPERRDGTPAVENRWWVDTGKTKERPKAQTGEQPPVGARFFRIGQGFEQEEAKARLTDLNLKILDEAAPPPGEWRTLHMLANESVPAGHIERMKRRFPLPPGARGVIVDSGRSVRFILTGEPVGERILEFTLGEASSFDCWIRGEWVCEELFSNVEDALRKARPYLGRFLGAQQESW